MSRTRRARADGFTLVEVMIAGAILGVLAALCTTNYLVYIERVRVARAIVEIKGIANHLDVTVIQGGTLPAALAAMGLAQNDPWGRPYEYLRIAGAPIGAVRKDQFLVPLNTDYDVYSSGVDHLSAARITHPTSLDDVLRGSNGAFIGLARNY